jgi:ABC-type transporter Mla subunit MlaD
MLKLVPYIVFSFMLIGCASHKEANQKVEAQISEAQASDSETLKKTMDDLINASTSLTEVQKTELRTTLTTNKATAENLNKELYRSKSVLFQELLSQKPDRKKIRLLKKSIKQLEAKKLKNTFETIEKISSIVSKNKVNDANEQEIIDRISSPERGFGMNIY